MAQVRRVLTFAPYNPNAEVTHGVLETYPWSAFRWRLLLASLESLSGQKGTPETRKKIAEVRRRFRKIGEIAGEGAEKGWRLASAGGEVVLLQSDLDLLRKLWADFSTQIGADVDMSTDTDDFLAEVPERQEVSDVPSPES